MQQKTLRKVQILKFCSVTFACSIFFLSFFKLRFFSGKLELKDRTHKAKLSDIVKFNGCYQRYVAALVPLKKLDPFDWLQNSLLRPKQCSFSRPFKVPFIVNYGI